MNEMKMKYIVKIYHNNEFIGYIKSYRKFRNSKYRFVRTIKINDAMQFPYKANTDMIVWKLSKLKDTLYYNDLYTFETGELTDQEIRKSKLEFLGIVKIREGIFKKVTKM